MALQLRQRRLLGVEWREPWLGGGGGVTTEVLYTVTVLTASGDFYQPRRRLCDLRYSRRPTTRTVPG